MGTWNRCGNFQGIADDGEAGIVGVSGSRNQFVGVTIDGVGITAGERSDGGANDGTGADGCGTEEEVVRGDGLDQSEDEVLFLKPGRVIGISGPDFDRESGTRGMSGEIIEFIRGQLIVADGKFVIVGSSGSQRIDVDGAALQIDGGEVANWG